MRSGTMSRWICSLALAGCLGASGLMAQEVAGNQDSKAEGTIQVMDRKQLSRMRGRLLYKKSQIRKMERAVLALNAQNAQRAAELERQRREMFMAVEPKLAVLYEDQDKLELQIKAAAEQLKKK